MFSLYLPGKFSPIVFRVAEGACAWTWGERTWRTEIVRTFPAESLWRGFNPTKVQLSKLGR